MKCLAPNRAYFVCLLLVAGLTTLSWRLLDLHYLRPEVEQRTASSRYELRETLPAERGLILDRNERRLAQNRPVATLIADKYHLSESERTIWGAAHAELRKRPDFPHLKGKELNAAWSQARKNLLQTPEKEIYEKHLTYALDLLSQKLGTPPQQLRQLLRGPSPEPVLAKNIRVAQADKIEQLLDECNIHGFRFRRSMQRYYPDGHLAPNILGFTGLPHNQSPQSDPRVGKTGIEKSMEAYLAGDPGYRVRKKNSRGLLISTQNAALRPPVPGLHIQLSLDANLQSIASEELAHALKTYQAKRGSIVITDPKTGDILALANQPTFDSNRREDLSGKHNFAIWSQYEPGSAFKIVAMSAVLNEGKATLDSSVHCAWGNLKRDGFRVPDHHPYGELTFSQVLAKSSNIGTYLFAELLGRKTFYDYTKKFGFGQKTGIPLPGESAGIVRPSKFEIDFSRASYGYSVSVTPLQLACAYNVIAGDGTWHQPRIVNKVIARDGRVIEEGEAHKSRRVISPEAARLMRKALTEVVSEKGTARRAAVEGYTVAGKTGTSWKYIPAQRRYDPERKFVTFAGMLPAQNPAFVCVVMLDEPQLGADDLPPSGGSVAAPVFAQVARRIAAQLNLTPAVPSGDTWQTPGPLAQHP